MEGSEPPRFAAEPAISILHVSDVQFGRYHRFADRGRDALLGRLCDDLDRLADGHGLRPDLVALTGDLAEWGMKRELDQVAAFGEGLLAHLKLAPERLLIVPGNHDINRKLCEAYFLRCAGDGEEPRPPYWPKWGPYVELFGRLYRSVERYRFTELEPWTLFEIPSLQVVVAGLNSTIHEGHRDADHHGFVGEDQLRWFDDRLAEYERKGWLRIGLVHHNAVRRAIADDENLRDADDLRAVLGERLHVLLHGHTHQGRIEMLGPSLPVLATGSAAVARDQRPGPQDAAGETPNQYQIVRLAAGGVWCFGRAYDHARKAWIGDTRVSPRGDRWWDHLARDWPRSSATFPSAATLQAGAADLAAVALDADGREPEAGLTIYLEVDDDLLDDAIGWCQIRGGREIADVVRVRHRGPWGDYAKVHDRDRGVGLLGAYRGELTAEILERWVADVHEPFRGRGQPVSQLVVAAAAIDPAVRAAAQVRGVEVERMIDYQRVLDTLGYGEKLHERLDKDREYPTEAYLEQRVTLWSPLRTASQRVDRAADWLAARLLEREGAFVLVLGQAGVGKTFLLREVARRLGRQQAIAPILVELRDLERARTIEELVATQFTRFDVPWHPRAFRRDLEQGRLALLFDGFDELALRVRSGAIPAHFERIYAAAVDRARIVVTSRTEHFLSRGEIADLMTPSSASTTVLGGMFERVQQRHVLELHAFERRDVRTYLGKRLGDAAGEARFARLERVHDLVGLACNPRMLGFLVDIPDDQLAQAAGLGESITSDALYRIVIGAWLAGQAERLSPPGAPSGPNAEALRDAATNLALQLWRDPAGGVRVEDVGAYAGDLLARMCDDDTEWATYTARARTLLLRDDRGQISFIHQTVLEWLVADRVADELVAGGPCAPLDGGRLNTFMIDLLRQRLGDDVLAGWAEARLASPTTNAASENARDVLKRLHREASVRAHLPHQDLRGQELAGQTLQHAVLDGADLTGARLVGRDLSGASLVGAQLAYADLSDACLRGANLRGANLAFARLHRAELEGAVLADARVTGASLLGARGPLPEAVRGAGTARTVPTPPSVDAMYGRTIAGDCRIAISPDGTLLVSGHSDGSVRLWDCQRGRLLRILSKHSRTVLSVAFSPDGALVASSAADATVRVWHAGDGSDRLVLTGHAASVWGVTFSPNGAALATCGSDWTVRVWSLQHATERLVLRGHSSCVRAVAFSPDGGTLASGGDDGMVRLWSAATGEERGRCADSDRGIWAVAFSPDGGTLASGGDDGRLWLWHSRTRTVRERLVGHEGRIFSIAFSPDGALVASGGDDGIVRSWSTIDGSERSRLASHAERVVSVAFSRDGRTLAAGATAVVRLWDAHDGSERTPRSRSRGTVWSVAFSPDGKTVASGGVDDALRLWNTRTGVDRARHPDHRSTMVSVAYSPDGALVAGAGADKAVRLWRASDGSDVARLSGHEDTVRSVAFSADGSMLASGAGDDTVRLWSVADRVERGRLTGHGGRAWSVAFSPDGRSVACGGEDGRVRLWNIVKRIDLALRPGHAGRVWSVAFSPDGRLLASGAADATVCLWQPRSGGESRRLIGHAGSVLSVAFSRDSALVASAGDDCTVRLWDVHYGNERARLVGHGGRVWSVAFSPDGKLVASGAADATLRLWEVATGRSLAILYGTAGGTVAARSDGRYRVRGDIAGQFWHVIGLHRYEVGELDALVPGLRLTDDEPLYAPP